jgi:hypothetical protein
MDCPPSQHARLHDAGTYFSLREAFNRVSKFAFDVFAHDDAPQFICMMPDSVTQHAQHAFHDPAAGLQLALCTGAHIVTGLLFTIFLRRCPPSRACCVMPSTALQLREIGSAKLFPLCFVAICEHSLRLISLRNGWEELLALR